MIITKKIPVGANVTWEASAKSYFPQHGSFVMPNSIKTLDIDLGIVKLNILGYV